MPVSEATATKAVEAWGLADGHTVNHSCGCRSWSRWTPMLTSRPVFTCERHRPAFAPRDVG